MGCCSTRPTTSASPPAVSRTEEKRKTAHSLTTPRSSRRGTPRRDSRPLSPNDCSIESSSKSVFIPSTAALGLYGSPTLTEEGGKEGWNSYQVRAVDCPQCGGKVVEWLLPHCPSQLILRRRVSDGTVEEYPIVQAHKVRIAEAASVIHQWSAMPPVEGYNLGMVVRLQRWWKDRLLLRRWFGVVFHYVHQKLERWEERRKSRRIVSRPSSQAAGFEAALSIEDFRPTADVATLPSEGLASYQEKESLVYAVLAVLEKGEQLPYGFVKSVLTEAEKALRERSNVQRLDLPSNARCVVVGDLHGQLPDLLHILREYNLPAEGERYFIFNGDFVDRGPKGCEVVCLILTLLLAYPSSVFVNRGNHEDEPMCENYEFFEEVLNKYSQALFMRFIRVFKSIPLCTVISNEIFVVHGGLPRDLVYVDDIDKIDRFQDVPMVPAKAPVTAPVDRRLLADMLWSDPVAEYETQCRGPRTPRSPLTPVLPGFIPNTDRGNGIMFREAHTEQFLRRNHLRLVIRSHEAPDSGFAISHNGMTVTVFSASYYAGVQRNDGAVALVSKKVGGVEAGDEELTLGELCVSFDTWKLEEDEYDDYLDETVSSPAVMPSAMGSLSTVTARNGPVVVQEVLRTIQNFVHEHRHRLMTSFTAIDSTRGMTGAVGAWEWAMLMKDITGCPEAPWAFLRRWLADAVWPAEGETQGLTGVPFMEYLRRYAVPLEDRMFRRWAPRLVRWIWHRSNIVRGDHTSPATLFDAAHPVKSLLSYNNFFNMVGTDLQTQLGSDVIFSLFCFLDKDDGIPGYLRRDAWVKHFRKVESLGIQQEQVLAEFDDGTLDWEAEDGAFHMWDLWLVRRIRQWLKSSPSPRAAYRMFDADGDGIIGTSDLRQAVDRLSMNRLKCPERRTLYTMSSKSLEQQKKEIADLAELFGESVETIKRGMSLGGALYVVIKTWPLSEHQANSFLTMLDYDGDGVVTFEDFMRSFYVVDLVCLDEIEAGERISLPPLSRQRPQHHRPQRQSSWAGNVNSPLMALKTACQSFRRVRESGSLACSRRLSMVVPGVEETESVGDEDGGGDRTPARE